MVSAPEMIDGSKIDLSNLRKFEKKQMDLCDLKYDPENDSIEVYFEKPCENTFIHFIDNEIGLIVSYPELSVVGIFFDYFTKFHLPNMPKLSKIWHKQHRKMEIDAAGIFSQYDQTKYDVTNEFNNLRETIVKKVDIQ